MEHESLAGQLLVATPSLRDPNFRRAVVLVCEHGEEGALGVVLSRPSETPVAEAVPHFADLVEPGDVVHVGGPVEPQAVMALAEFTDHAEAAAMVLGDVGFAPGDADPAALAEATRRARVFAGYSGWTAGQLEAELAEGSWIVAPAEPEDVFADEPEQLWPTVLRRLGGQFTLLATMPPDPSLN